MKVAVASDHAGFDYKERAKTYLKSKGFEVGDYGAHNAERSDYPDLGNAAAEGMCRGGARVGVLWGGFTGERARD